MGSRVCAAASALCHRLLSSPTSRPSTCKSDVTRDQFVAQIESQWQATTWANKKDAMKPCSDLHGWLDYIAKRRSKATSPTRSIGSIQPGVLLSRTPETLSNFSPGVPLALLLGNNDFFYISNVSKLAKHQNCFSHKLTTQMSPLISCSKINTANLVDQGCFQSRPADT